MQRRYFYVTQSADAKVSVPRAAKRYVSFICLVKFTFPKSMEASVHCFHTSCFIIVLDLLRCLRLLMDSSALLQCFRAGSPSQPCIQSLPALSGLKPRVKSGLSTAKFIFKVTGSFKSELLGKAQLGFELHHLIGKTKHLSSHICPCVNYKGQLQAYTDQNGVRGVQSCAKCLLLMIYNTVPM